jgi:phosphoglycolate phosphatase-like HAD superfamily hydrolase
MSGRSTWEGDGGHRYGAFVRTAVTHVVWDWNGTLLDDNHAVLAAVNHVCQGFGRAPVTLEEWRATFRRPIVSCYEGLLARPLSADDWAELDRLYHDAYHALLDTCSLVGGGTEALSTWRAGGRTQSLLSMWVHDRLTELVSALGLGEYFARVDGLRQNTGGGSKARHLVEHLNDLDLDPRVVVLIGDVVDDSDAAEAAGTRCVLVTTGMGSAEALRRTGRPVADTVTDALRLIG